MAVWANKLVLAASCSLAVHALPGCQACGEVWNLIAATKRISDAFAERCTAGREEELALPLTDDKVTATLGTIDRLSSFLAAVPDDPERAGDEFIAVYEASGMGCGPQLVAFSKVLAAIDVLRSRRGLPELAARADAEREGETSKARASLTEADLALVDARFDEVNRAVERLPAKAPKK